ncbi:MAG TPA: SAM-dependent methyltransferase [Actinomycetota bacterium]|nr:SAM-dependent methyltransferase [Actinomycetota bacterium]
MPLERLGGSFRDPSGFVFRRDGDLLRQINEVHRQHWDHLASSGLYDALVGNGLMVPHQEVDLALAATSDAYKVIRPEPVPFISYPYEWSFGQLKDAARATLQIQRTAIEHGMSLRDASAYNIQWLRGKPVLIDTLSFETLRDGEPWVAYRQFCQHFLAPLALAAYRDVRLLQLSRVHLDGVPLDLARELLPRRSKLRASLLLHIHAHAKSQKRHAGEDPRASAKGRKLSTRGLQGIIASLDSAVRALDWQPPKTVWTDYYAEADHYTAEATDHKRRLVSKLVEETAPSSVWDLGGNVGAFARIATAQGIPTVCFDIDPGCVEAAYRDAVVRDGDANLLPLVMDLTNPSPRIGWENTERDSLADRGPADLALALALVHHLAIGNNVPLERVADFFADLTDKLIIEFVPKSDPKAIVLLRARDDIFPHYTADGFEAAFSKRFNIERREPIVSSERSLYLMRRRA